MYSEFWGKIHFWSSLLSVNLLFFPMHFVGLAGMPRRYSDYALQFADFNWWISIGGFWFGLSQLILLKILIDVCFRKKGAQATSEVWEGAEGLEWTLPSPAPYHSFTTPPLVK
jgi:cytochrome c oxidase subunit 1